MKRILSARFVLVVVLTVLGGSELTDVLICPRPTLAAEQLESLPPARLPNQIALHAKLLPIYSAKLAEAKTELGEFIDWNGGPVADEKPSGRTCKVKLLAEGEWPKKLERLRERDIGKVIAEPTVVTLDGREATIHMGSQVPILEVDQTVNGERQSLHRFQQIGHTIRLVPKLADQETVHLGLSHEVNQMSLTGKEESLAWPPKLESRKTETSVKLRPGQTVVLVNWQAVEDGESEIEPAIFMVAVTPEVVGPLDAADTPVPYGDNDNAMQFTENSPRGMQASSSPVDEIKSLERELELLLGTYTPNHPKVKSLQNQLESLRRRQSESVGAVPAARKKPAKTRLPAVREPSPRLSGPAERQEKAAHSNSILSEIRALREEVKGVRRDVNRLIGLLEDRQGSKDRPDGMSEAASQPVGDDASAESWDMTLREAIMIALQNSKTLTMVSVESTTGGPIKIRRSNTDMSLTDAKDAAADVVRDVERAYWDAWRACRNLDTMKAGRDASLESWRNISSPRETSDAFEREQYFLFRGEVENALREVYASEQRLRFLVGLASDDGRLIRPSDDPDLTRPRFDWNAIREEALENRTELSRQRWKIRQRELELAAAKAAAKPAMDVSNAYQWTERQQFLPVGQRTQLSGIRNAQSLLVREQGALEDIELNAVHELTEAVRNLEAAYVLAQTYSSRRKAAGQEVEALTKHQSQGASPDALADAPNRRAATAIEYWNSLTDFASALGDFHLKKGSLLSYRNIVMDDSAAAEREKASRDASD